MIPYVIAQNTFREATRDRVLAGIIAAGIVALIASTLLGPLALGEGVKLTVDLGLSAISVLGFLAVLMVGTSLVAKEVERRTVYNMLSRPISRHSYLIGKWGGLVAALWVMAVTLGVALCLVLVMRGSARHGPAVLEAVYLAGLELTVVTSIAVLFSALTTPVLSALYTLGLYAIGQWSYDLREFANQFPPIIGGIVTAAANVVPNLPMFNMRTLASAAETTTVMHLVLATLYALVYCTCTLALATVSFEERDFK